MTVLVHAQPCHGGGYGKAFLFLELHSFFGSAGTLWECFHAASDVTSLHPGLSIFGPFGNRSDAFKVIRTNALV
ncbi:hypothetical protein J2782_003301 [Brucella pseudogrignonensis]|uniref:Uncharacterized protein n=1 Tax=Brucella pseudogrignonensis TaxID=419475 RepID=A0ABU1MBY2_9HYPH|nr:hypothetical protein [Brucella pseudogrignonensis]